MAAVCTLQRRTISNVTRKRVPSICSGAHLAGMQTHRVAHGRRRERLCDLHAGAAPLLSSVRAVAVSHCLFLLPGCSDNGAVCFTPLLRNRSRTSVSALIFITRLPPLFVAAAGHPLLSRGVGGLPLRRPRPDLPHPKTKDDFRTAGAERGNGGRGGWEKE